MGERKDIDRLFQEQFKDFEKSPSPEMWARIEQELQKDKRKRRFVPIWWRIGAAAALLLLFISVGLNWFESRNATSDTKPTVVDVETPAGPQEDPATPEQNASKTTPESHYKSLTDSTEKERTESKRNANPTKNTSTIQQHYTAALPPVSVEEKTATAKGTMTHSERLSKLLALKSNSYHSSPAAVYVALETPESPPAPLERYEGESIEKAIAAAEALEEAGMETTAQARWRLSPTVAPVYSTALGEGSTIHTQFIENSKSSDITMSYGITGSYALSKRLKLRAGVNRVDFSNRTSDVLAFEAVEMATQTPSAVMANISPNEDSNVLLMSGASVNRNLAPEAINTMQRGDMTLDYGFIEVPLALEYRVLDKRFGINLVGGFSTFFLNNNQISVDFNSRNAVIGEANNINDTSYSANVGLGFDYSISKSLDFMLEPTFKYQINTFSNTFGNVQPYIIGVYTGLNFKF